MDVDNILDGSGTADAEMYINEPIRAYLTESARWAKFIAIISFVFLGLGILGMLIGGGAALTTGMPGAGGIFIFVYLVVIGITFIPIYYLYQFAVKTQAALRDNDQGTLRDAFENHKSMFKFYGIFLAIVLGFYALAIVIGVIGGLASL